MMIMAKINTNGVDWLLATMLAREYQPVAKLMSIPIPNTIPIIKPRLKVIKLLRVLFLSSLQYFKNFSSSGVSMW